MNGVRQYLTVALLAVVMSVGLAWASSMSVTSSGTSVSVTSPVGNFDYANTGGLDAGIITATAINLTAGSGGSVIQFANGAGINFSVADSDSYITRTGTSTISQGGGTVGTFKSGAFIAGKTAGDSYTSNAASGINALAVITNGARVDFGAGANDYASSDGTTVTFAGPLNTSASLRLATVLTDSATAVTVTACTSPTVTWSNGTAAFQFDVGGTCAGISTAVITLPTAANGWGCDCVSVSAPATRVVSASAWSTTQVTITNYSRTLGTAADFADGADIRCMCRGG